MSTICGKAIVVAINLAGYHPEIWLAEKMNVLWPEFQASGAGWIIAAIIGLTLYIIEVRFKLLESIAFLNPEKRITLLDFYKKAEKDGWDFFNNELRILDLTTGLKQAALDRTIIISGRLKQITNYFTQLEPLQDIDSSYWKDHFLDPLMIIDINKTTGMANGFAEDNTRTCTHKNGERPDIIYNDIHLDKRAAFIWLKKEAKKFIGKHKYDENTDFNLMNEQKKLEDEIRELELVKAQTPTEIASQKKQLSKLREQLEDVNRQLEDI